MKGVYEGRTKMKKERQYMMWRGLKGTKKRNKVNSYQISDERSIYIFEPFWDLDWSQRKIEVYHLVDRNQVYKLDNFLM